MSWTFVGAVALAPNLAAAQHVTTESAGTIVSPTSAPTTGSTVLGYGNYAARAAAAALVSASSVRAPVALPLASTMGPEVLHVQILLDAARFAPGILDGRWSENTLFALRAFREAQALPVSDSVDVELWARLQKATGDRDPLTRYTLSADDVRGPYRALPKSIYAKAQRDCLCYESMIEQLGERFHTSTDVLRRINPDVDFAHASAGTPILVPNVARVAAPRAATHLRVTRGEGSVRGYDRVGNLVFWLPSTVGSTEEPSPRGTLRVTSITRNPRYHYNPLVLGDVPDSRPDAMLAPGPNSPVGVLWAQLSKDHVGIHGTADPELVGYAQSHGCVRVTNWDARWLADLLVPGMIVDFR
jgi:lipoprotein-anchoring transpeptidase ErfK/SrfK